MKVRSVILFCILLLFAAPAALAQQERLVSLTNPNDLTTFTSDDAWGENITVQSNWLINMVSVATGYQNAQGDAVVHIRADNKTTIQGDLLCTSNTTTLTNVYTSAREWNFSFSTACNISSEVHPRIWVVINRTDPSTGNIGIAGNISEDTYELGRVVRYNGGSFATLPITQDANIKLYGQEGGPFNDINLRNACFSWESPSKVFYLLDERNISAISGDMDVTLTFNKSASTTQTKTYTDFDDVFNSTICLSSPDIVIEVDYSIDYTSTGYVPRRFAQDNILLTDSQTTTYLYLLSSLDGLYGRFNTVDQFGNNEENVLAKMTHPTNGLTEARLTDSAGTVAFWVDPDVTYNFSFSKSGFQTNNFNLRVTSTDASTVTMTEESTVDQSFFSGISYQFAPDEVLVNNTPYNFTFNLTSSIWNITACTFYIKNATQTLSSSSSSFNGSRCDIGIEFNVGNQTKIILDGVYRLNNTANFTVSREYSVIYSFVGDFSLKVFLDDVRGFSGGGFGNFTRWVLALIIITVIVAIASKETATFREEIPALLLIWFLVMFFSYVGWFSIGLESIPEVAGMPLNWLNDWIVFIVITLGGGAYLLNKG